MENPSKLYPLIVSEKIAATRAYYVDQLGCELSFDTPDYIQVRFAGADGPELAFMHPKAAPSLGRELPSFDGKGLIISVPTDSADRRHKELSAKKVTLMGKPEDRPWGWRSFGLADPNGVMLDFFHVLEEAAPADATG